MTTTTEQLQPIVNAFAAHLREQGRRSVGDEGQCLYRGPNGVACGVGGLIKDEHYDPTFESEGAWTGEIREALSLSGYPNSEIGSATLEHLQRCHDKADDECFVESFEDRLRNFCETYQVQYPQAA